MLMYNTSTAQLELSKLAFNSAASQDIGMLDIYLVDNGSAHETWQWMSNISIPKPHRIHLIHYPRNTAPTIVANEVSAMIFNNSQNHDMVLGMPNDVILPTNMYRMLNRWPRGFVAAFMNGYRDQVVPCEEPIALHEDVHMSVMLTRGWAYNAIVDRFGYFHDPGYFLYASDVDLKLRMAACGLHGVQLDIQCYHYGSACWRLAAPGIGDQITTRANDDRAYFEGKWGFQVSDPQFHEKVTNLNFRG